MHQHSKQKLSTFEELGCKHLSFREKSGIPAEHIASKSKTSGFKQDNKTISHHGHNHHCNSK